ncbi:nucleotide exchange factor GrpE [Clostridium sp. Marseille-Q2269]|uniref:nucleotide exchange factor GrpE n=1 Tax=Clostridium sp. Marseille-Q2269 TaxID=2942205 RepID=UPI002072EFB9|nr:nucleotide exchange factor GrpE [Clostridium sp. Marseille-Q2269]
MEKRCKDAKDTEMEQDCCCCNEDSDKKVEDEVKEDLEFEELEEELEKSDDSSHDSNEEKIKELEDMKNKLKEENKKLENQLEEIKERLVRTVAEYDNFRKRTTKEKEELYVSACEDVLKEMLPVLDNLQRAATVEGSIEDIKKGIDMTVKQFETSLEKLGVEEISTEVAFDPNMHNAVMHVEDSNLGEKEIVEVFQKGYKKGEKVIRYSMVKVAN